MMSRGRKVVGSHNLGPVFVTIPVCLQKQGTVHCTPVNCSLKAGWFSLDTIRSARRRALLHRSRLTESWNKSSEVNAAQGVFSLGKSVIILPRGPALWRQDWRRLSRKEHKTFLHASKSSRQSHINSNVGLVYFPLCSLWVNMLRPIQLSIGRFQIPFSHL